MKLEWLSRSAHWMIPGATLIAARAGDVYGNVVIYHGRSREPGFVRTALNEMISAMQAYKVKRDASQG